MQDVGVEVKRTADSVHSAVKGRRTPGTNFKSGDKIIKALGGHCVRPTCSNLQLIAASGGEKLEESSQACDHVGKPRMPCIHSSDNGLLSVPTAFFAQGSMLPM